MQHGFDSTPHWADTVDEPTFIFGGHTKADDLDFDLFYWDSSGRIKFERDNPDPNFWMGYRALTMSISGDQPLLPGDLTDVAITGAFHLNDAAETWRVDLAGGAGTANDGHWSNTDAMYGIGILNAARQLDQDTVLHIGVSFYGNRVLLPDVPLPYVSIFQRLSDEFSYNLGVLSSGVTWKVYDDLTISAAYLTGASAAATVEYELSQEFSAFVDYKRTIDGFFLDDQNNTRLFYGKRQVAAGIGWGRGAAFDVRLGAGYAFDQEFSAGFDVRELDAVAHPSDEMLFFLTLRGTF